MKKVSKFNEDAYLNPYIDINTDLRKKMKNDFKKDFFELMNNSVFGKLWKMWENIEVSNLPQQKEEGTISCENQIIILQSFSQKIY